MMSRRSLAKERRNSYYRRSLEWEVFRQIEVEVERSAFVWAIGLDEVAPASGGCESFSGCWKGSGLTAALIVHFQLNRPASSQLTETPWMGRQASARAGLSSDLLRRDFSRDRSVPRMQTVSRNHPRIKTGSGCEHTF